MFNDFVELKQQILSTSFIDINFDLANVFL